jgi:hypothetical protein
MTIGTVVYSAPGTRFMAEAFGQKTWISSHASPMQGRNPVLALAFKNVFGGVSFTWCDSEADVKAELAKRASSVLPVFAGEAYEIVAVSSRPETVEEANL